LTKEPAVYKTVQRKVVKTPASSRNINIPAEYKTVKVRKLVSKPEEKRIVIPAEYKTITLQELNKDGYMEWRSILCETNMTGGRISAIQSALKKAGYNPGPIDGVIGEQTIIAVNAFQKDKGLPVDKYLNLETLKALGVSAR
jgi:peptidoglycan hydrolase-like protein with peptidoglycan-binding domain